MLVTLGAQEAVYLAFLSLIEPGDEVLLPSHRFTSYDAGIELCGGRVRTYPTVFGNDYRLDPEDDRARDHAADESDLDRLTGQSDGRRGHAGGDRRGGAHRAASTTCW